MLRPFAFSTLLRSSCQCSSLPLLFQIQYYGTTVGLKVSKSILIVMSTLKCCAREEVMSVNACLCTVHNTRCVCACVQVDRVLVTILLVCPFFPYVRILEMSFSGVLSGECVCVWGG